MTEWFVSSAVLAALLIGAHYLLRGKISARLQYALWLVLLVRLLLPLSVGKTALSVANEFKIMWNKIKIIFVHFP